MGGCGLGWCSHLSKHETVTDEKSSVEHAVEVVVYAPIGFILEVRKMVPTFVERGRQKVQMAKIIGQFAVKQGQVEAEKRLGHVAAQADAVLSEFGLRSTDKVTVEGLHEAGGNATVSPESPLVVVAHPVAAEPVAPVVPVVLAGDLAIADYDSLAASQVIPRLAGLEDDQLADVGRYETANRHRKTILGKIAQLQGS